jgi:hypothetical protein
MPTDTKKLPLGGPAWLRAIADDKEEMLHALGAFDAEGEREEKREILGLRDAAARMEKLERALATIVEGATKPLTDQHPGALLRCEMEDIAREALKA